MKKITAISLILALLLCFAACGSGSSDEETTAAPVSASEVAAGLVSRLSFTYDTMDEGTKSAALSVYGINGTLCTDASLYTAGSGTAEEVGVFVCPDSYSASQVLTLAKARVDYLKEGYSDYGPDQVEKIDRAVVTARGNVIVVCICLDPENVDGALKGLLG